MSDRDAKAIVAEGVSDGIKRAPLVYALVVLSLVIAYLLWELISDAKIERQETNAYIQELHMNLNQCYRENYR